MNTVSPNTISGVEEASGHEEVEEGTSMEERAHELLKRVEELEDRVIKETGRRPIVSPVPDRPTDKKCRSTIPPTRRHRIGAHTA